MDSLLVERYTPVIANLLDLHNYVFISGRQMTAMLATNVDEVTRFKNCWSHLELDRFMADGGMYRHRRYGQYLKHIDSTKLTLLPHQAFVQSLEVNSLNGGMDRHFAPLTKVFMTSPILDKLLLMMSNIFDWCEGRPRDWIIGVHPQRIVADGAKKGLPTPEGLHRNGVTYMATIVMRRNNITGGDTRITDANKKTLECLVLDQPLDMVLANDNRTLHEVSPIASVCQERCAYRDVLVVTFTKMEN